MPSCDRALLVIPELTLKGPNSVASCEFATSDADQFASIFRFLITTTPIGINVRFAPLSSRVVSSPLAVLGINQVLFVMNASRYQGRVMFTRQWSNVIEMLFVLAGWVGAFAARYWTTANR